MIILTPTAGLLTGLARARANGYTGPIKVSVRTRENVSLQYVEGPGGSWVLHGKPSLLGRRWRRKFTTARSLDRYLEKLGTQDVQIRPREPRVIATGRYSDTWRVDLAEFPEIAKRVGEDVFVAFMRCFVGADRLKSLIHFYIAAKEKYGGPAAERNFHTSWLLMVGALHELGEALQGLNATRVHLRLRNQSRWRPLERLRKKWYTHPVASRVRNQAGFHLGSLHVYKRGLAILGNTCVDAPLRMGHGKGHLASFARCAWDIHFSGFAGADGDKPELQMDQMKQLMVDAGVTHRKLHPALEAFFLAVLKDAGIGVTPGITP
jgi:hypothetical protein